MIWPGPISLENPSGINFNKDIKLKKEDYVMELYWDYNYYQPQTDNEWIVEKIIAIRDERDKNNVIDDISAYQGQDFRLDQTNYRYWTKKEILKKPQGNYRQILSQLGTLE